MNKGLLEDSVSQWLAMEKHIMSSTFSSGADLGCRGFVEPAESRDTKVRFMPVLLIIESTWLFHINHT